LLPIILKPEAGPEAGPEAAPYPLDVAIKTLLFIPYKEN
jgi:hypothetical protein